MSYETPKVVQVSGAQTPPGQSAAFAVPAGATVDVWVSVTAVGTTITFSMQWSDDGGTTWAAADPADVFTAITTNIAVVKSFTAKAPLCRLAWVGTGASTFEARVYEVGA